MNPHLEHLAQRVAADPSFLAAALAEYAHSEKIDDVALAQRLGCPAEVLGHLRLCGMPRSEPPRFRQDIAQIASRFAVRADVLAEVVRRGQVLRQMRGGVPEQGLLLAARDDEEKDP